MKKKQRKQRPNQKVKRTHNKSNNHGCRYRMTAKGMIPINAIMDSIVSSAYQTEYF